MIISRLWFPGKHDSESCEAYSDPYDNSSPAITVGPRMIMCPFDPKATGLADNSSNTGDYIVWSSSPYAHVHVMGLPAGNQWPLTSRSSKSWSRTPKAKFIDSEGLDLGFQRLARQPELRSGAFGTTNSAGGL